MTHKTITIDGIEYDLVPKLAYDLKPIHAGYHPVTGKAFQCAHRDFPAPMTWEKGNKIITAECSGWRRPTIEELYVLYANREAIGGFATERGSGHANWYWSCSEGRSDPSFVYDVVFADGRVGWGRKDGLSLSSRLIKSEHT